MKNLFYILLFIPLALFGQTRYEYYTVGDNYDATITSSDDLRAQIFTVGTVGSNEDFPISSVRIKVSKVGSPGDVTVSIRAVAGDGWTPTGESLSSGTLPMSEVGTEPAWHEVAMSSYELQASTSYVLQFSCSGIESNYPKFRASSTGTYPGGYAIYSIDGGDNWSQLTSYDYMFEIWGAGPQDTTLYLATYQDNIVDDGGSSFYITADNIPQSPGGGGAESDSMTILWDHDFADISEQAYSQSQWNSYWEGQGFDEEELYVSSGGCWNYGSGAWPTGVSASWDSSGNTVYSKALQLTQLSGTEGNNYTFDYRLTLSETFDTTATDRYFRFNYKKTGDGWSTIGSHVEWKMLGIIAGTYWSYETGYSFEWDSTVYKNNYDEAGYGPLQMSWCGDYPPRQRVYDWIKHKIMGHGINSSSYSFRTYQGFDSQIWISNKAVPLKRQGETVVKYYDGGWESATLRLVSGTNNNADGFMEYYINDTLAYRFDNDTFQSLQICWDGGETGDECGWGEQCDLDSMVMKDQGVTASQIILDFHLTCDEAYKPTDDCHFITDDYLLFEYDENYDSAYYNQKRPWGSVLREIPEKYKKQLIPWWLLLILIPLTFRKRRRR